MTVAAGAIGHTFGVKVHRVQKVQKVQRVVVSPLRAMSMKSALWDLLSVSYDIISITSISHLRWLSPPFGSLRHHLPPAERCDNKALKNSLLIIDSTVSTGLRERSNIVSRFLLGGDEYKFSVTGLGFCVIGAAVSG